MRSDFYVYVLFREDGSPFYIGKGRTDRWLEHEREARKGGQSRRVRIIRKMLRAGWSEVPKIKLHEGLTNDLAAVYEIILIAAIGRLPNGPLVNETAGGDGAVELSAEARAKISASKAGVSFAPEHSAKIAASLKGIKRSPETRAKVSAARKGKKGPPLSAQRVASLHAARSARYPNGCFAGRKHSPETLARMSEAQKARRRRERARV